MDGNRRWARQKGLSVITGHEHVVDDVLEPLVDRCIELKIPYLTLWAFSTENWERDKFELEGLMRIFRKALERKVEDLHKKGVRLNVLGDIDRFPKDIADKTRKWMDISKNNTKITVNLALNYGGRDEIVRGIRKLVHTLKDTNKLDDKNITIQNFQSCLDTGDMPDPDLIIRPGGQKRLSGFLPWQCVYSELYFTDKLMPDFTVEELNIALEDYSDRQRRFGK